MTKACTARSILEIKDPLGPEFASVRSIPFSCRFFGEFDFHATLKHFVKRFLNLQLFYPFVWTRLHSLDSLRSSFIIDKIPQYTTGVNPVTVYFGFISTIKKED